MFTRFFLLQVGEIYLGSKMCIHPSFQWVMRSLPRLKRLYFNPLFRGFLLRRRDEIASKP